MAVAEVVTCSVGHPVPACRAEWEDRQEALHRWAGLIQLHKRSGREAMEERQGEEETSLCSDR